MTRSRHPPITDWDEAYDNRAAVGDVASLIDVWNEKAQVFRERMPAGGRVRLDQPYGAGERQRFDLFSPDSAPRGLVVFVHGGYWRTFDKSTWSHLAEGALAHGFAAAIPSYTLCPDVRITDITSEIGAFLTHIARDVPGDIRLAGHSAGGHLVARMACGALGPDLAGRLSKIVSISGVHDLRPLLRTELNATLRLDLAEARAESPVLLEPVDGTDLTCWAGADELPAFRQQNALLADIWHGLGATTEAVEASGKNHFTVVDALADPNSDLVATLLA